MMGLGRFWAILEILVSQTRNLEIVKLGTFSESSVFKFESLGLAGQATLEHGSTSQ